jgi:long-chain acyl-CoA synthetase
MRIGYFSGDPLKLMEDCAILQPTFFPSVPRLYNKIYGKLIDKFKEATGIKGSLINTAVSSKLAKLQSGGGFTHCLYDKIVFNKVKAMLGGKVKVMLTGSAPIDGKVLNMLKICFCCPIIEGYGMTESSGGSLTTFPDDPETGHVGGVLQNVKLRLRDIPEMNYYHTDPIPRGEIVFYGSSVMSGYFKNEEKSLEAFSDSTTNTRKDGWMHSGDVGMVFPNGTVKIIDRAKNIFKLSQGEYIAPEKLENLYVQSEWVLQSWMYGDSLRDYVVGIVVVDPERLAKYAKEIGKEANDNTLLDDTLKQIVLADLHRLAKASEFNSLEKPKEIILTREPFTIENNILTPTMKLKRNICKEKFQTQID